MLSATTPVRYVPAPSVVVTALSGEVILLDSASGAMFALSGSGCVVWEALERGEAAAAASLVAHFDVTPERAAADVAALLRDLLDAALIEKSPARADEF